MNAVLHIPRVVHRVTIGVDPGVTGALAVLADGRADELADMPICAADSGDKSVVDSVALAGWLRDVRGRFPGASFVVVIERVQPMPSQARHGRDGERRSMGATSAFNFGRAFEAARSVALAMGFRVVTVPSLTWKRSLGLDGQAKDVARVRAIARFPEAQRGLTRRKDGGRADALWIAKWAEVTEA
jgi:hypothetical protein